MMTLGQLKTFFATATVNQSLQGTNSPMGSIVHWVATDIISTADFWWNRGSTSFDTVDGTAQYFLSNQVQDDKIWGMFDEDNDKPLHKKDLEWIYAADPTPTDEGDADYWAYVGQASCQAVATAAGTVSVSSSASADTQKDVVITGVSSGVERYEILTLQGTSTVTGPISWAVTPPLSINLGEICTGVITVTRGAVTVAEIPPKHLRVLRPHVRLFKVPGTTGDTINYFFYKRATEPVSDADLIDIPDIAFKALRYGLEEISFFLVGKLQASTAAHKKYQEAIRELIAVSERDIAGNEIKNWRESIPLTYRLPDTITGSVLV